MNWSPAPMALVPPAVVTVTSIAFVPPGETAVIEDAELTVKLALAEPNLTVVAPLKLVPVMVTAVPPAAGPWLGLSFVTLGAAT